MLGIVQWIVSKLEVKMYAFGLRFGRRRILQVERDIREDEKHLKKMQESISDIEIKLASLVVTA